MRTADRSRLRCKAVADRVTSAEDAAAFIAPGNHVGMSGFTGSGHPKAVPAALVVRVTEAAERDNRFTVSVWTGSSTVLPYSQNQALERSPAGRGTVGDQPAVLMIVQLDQDPATGRPGRFK